MCDAGVGKNCDANGLSNTVQEKITFFSNIEHRGFFRD